MAASTQKTLERLQAHISEVSLNQQTPLDIKLFDEAELILPNNAAGIDLLPLLQQLSVLLPTLRQDPAPAAELLMKLLDDFPFTSILSFDPPVDFAGGLQGGEHMVSFNKLVLFLLHKATLVASDAAAVASQPALLLALVRLWLCTPDIGVATQASRVLIELLAVDHAVQLPDAHLPQGGQGLVWKRVFSDQNVYSEIFKICSLDTDAENVISKNQKTLAQARLLEWIPHVAKIDWSAITQSHHSSMESHFGASCLLDFAALRMVDIKNDVIMYKCLIEFYSELLEATKPIGADAAATVGSLGLEYLVKSGLHQKTASIFVQKSGVQLDMVESMFLYGSAANYVATYASQYPEHFLDSPMRKDVHERLIAALTISPSQWAHGDPPRHDLHVISCVPRRTLLPGERGDGNWTQSPLSLLPSGSTAPDVMDTLATIFHGPEKAALVYPLDSPLSNANSDRTHAPLDRAAAKALYYHYVSNNPRFWNDVIRHADTLALKELALASLNCLTAVITSNWALDAETGGFAMPTNIATPEGGHLAILSPPALEFALPYLLRPPQTFANLVGGRGDSESTVYKVAIAKFSALRALQVRIASEVESRPGEGFEDILKTINKRMAEGPLSREGEIGGKVGTLEL